MATLPIGPKFVINAAQQYQLSDGSDNCVSTHALMLVSSSFVGSVTVKAISRARAAVTDGVTPVPVQYVARYLNGAIATDSLGSAAITGTSLILIPSSGQVPVLDCTAYTSGTLTVYVVQLEGAAA